MHSRKEERDRGRGSKNPTFSSTLLEEIYQSMAGDETGVGVPDLSSAKRCVKKLREEDEEKEEIALRRACLIEKWMDKKIRDRNSLLFDSNLDSQSLFMSSSSSSSGSSSGVLSSSDNDSFRRSMPWSSSSYELGKHPKPIRTGGSSEKDKFASKNRDTSGRTRDVMPERHSKEDGLIKSESRALKIYNNLKKMKPPASPGGRMTAFINSLFQGHTRKHDVIASRRKKHTDEAVCSSASSFSRSCLNKNTPTTREKLRDSMKEPSKLRKDANTVHSKEFHWSLKEYCNGSTQAKGKGKEDDDCDNASCASSDLFELDHLAAVGRFRKELPVYETTRLGFRRSLSNRARV